MAYSKVPLFCIHCSGLTFALYNVISLFSSHSGELNRIGIAWDLLFPGFWTKHLFASLLFLLQPLPKNTNKERSVPIHQKCKMTSNQSKMLALLLMGGGGGDRESKVLLHSAPLLSFIDRHLWVFTVELVRGNKVTDLCMAK